MDDNIKNFSDYAHGGRHQNPMQSLSDISNGISDAEQRIKNLHEDLCQIEKKLQRFRDDVHTAMNGGTCISEKPISPQNDAVERKFSNPQAGYGQMRNECQNSEMPAVYEKNAFRQQTDKTLVHKKKNIEELFGKKMMGIFASALIFIGIILFGAAIMPMLPNFAKAVAMYAFSGIIAYAGYTGIKKRGQDGFNMTMTGIGLGSIFVTTLACNIMLGIFNDWITFTILLAWVFLMIYVHNIMPENGKNTGIFLIIGQIGLMVSVLMGCGTCAYNEDIKMFIMLIIYDIIGMALFHCLKKNKINRLLVAYSPADHVFHAINSLFMTVTYAWYLNASGLSVRNMSIYDYAVLVLIAFSVLYDGYVAYAKEKQKSIYYNLSMPFHALLLTILIMQAGINTLTVLLSYAVCMMMFIAVEKQDLEYKLFAHIPLFAEAVIILSMDRNAYSIYAAVMVIPLLLLGYFRKDKRYTIESTVLMWLWVIQFIFRHGLGWVGLISTALFALIYIYLCEKDKLTGTLIYAIMMIMTFASIGKLCDEVIAIAEDELVTDVFSNIPFMAAGILHITLSKMDNVFNSRCEKIALRIANAMLMINGCAVILDYAQYSTIVFLPSLIITAMLFMLNSKELLENAKGKGHELWVEIYIAFKYMILVLTVINAFDTNRVIVSLFLIIMSLISIATGFKYRRKGFRIFGLIIAIISIIKLIMVDIHSENTVANALCFILCGISCLSISFLYGKAEKRISGND